MKFSLTTKLAFCYFILAVAFFFVINFSLKGYLFDKMAESATEQMTAAGNTLQYKLAMKDLDSDSATSHIKMNIDAACAVSNYSISYFNYNGTPRYSSCSNKKDAGHYHSKKQKKKYKKTLSKEQNSPTTLNGFFDTEQLCTVTTITQYQHPVGYLVIGMPVSQLEDETVSLVSIYSLFLILIYLFLLMVFILLYFMHVYPIQKIITAAKEYSKGHFDYELVIRSNDEYRERAETLSYMAVELKNLDDYQRTFIANVPHYFRSPLTAIKGYVEAFLDGTIPPEMQDKYLNIILFETNRLTNLTSNLLTINNFENGKNQLDITVFDINASIRQTVDSFESITRKKDVRIECNFAEEHTYVKADMPKIQQVLHNLIDNAIKFSHSNSKIIVSTENIRDKTFIHVKDFGVGIPDDSLGKIWDRFYKTDPSRGKDKKGTGLGLSITKKIINAHNERIRVTSTIGAGTEFVFSLPHIRKVSIQP